MFDQFKKIAELKKLQDSLKKETVISQENGISVTMNGNFEVENVKLNPDLNLEDQEKSLKICLNKAKEEIQKKMAKSLMGSGLGF
jgi:DNA-binding protein YbaB